MKSFSKRAVWINLMSTVSTSLDTKINVHDIDSIALSDMLEKSGFEVYLQEPYYAKNKQSSYSKKIFLEDLNNFSADIALVCCGYYFFDYIKNLFIKQLDESTRDYRPTAKHLEQSLKWLRSFKGEIYIFLTDPRPAFTSIFSVTKDKLKFKDKSYYELEVVDNLLHLISTSKIIAPSKEFLDASLKDRVVEVEYWKNVDIPVLGYCEQYRYNSVYAGVKQQTKYRTKLITDWYNESHDCYTAGEIKIQGLKSLTGHKKCSLTDVIEFTKYSKTSLLCGEENHTWLTPRAIQSLICGTIVSVHPEFRAIKLLDESIINNQTFNSMNDFDESLLKEEVYKKQVSFIRELKYSAKLPTL